MRVDLFRLYEGEYVPGRLRQRAAAPASGREPLRQPELRERHRSPGRSPTDEQHNLRRTYRRTSFTLARLLANMGVAGPTPLLARFSSPVTAAKPEKRWLDAFYLDQPEEWDDPYRFFRW